MAITVNGRGYPLQLIATDTTLDFYFNAMKILSIDLSTTPYIVVVQQNNGLEGNIMGAYTKITTGDLDAEDAYEGMIVINTEDDNVKIYAESQWRQLATWQLG